MKLNFAFGKLYAYSLSIFLFFKLTFIIHLSINIEMCPNCVADLKQKINLSQEEALCTSSGRIFVTSF